MPLIVMEASTRQRSEKKTIGSMQDNDICKISRHSLSGKKTSSIDHRNQSIGDLGRLFQHLDQGSLQKLCFLHWYSTPYSLFYFNDSFSHSSIVVSTARCGRADPGSIPGNGI